MRHNTQPGHIFKESLYQTWENSHIHSHNEVCLENHQKEYLKQIPLWNFFNSRRRGPASFVMKIAPG